MLFASCYGALAYFSGLDTSKALKWTAGRELKHRSLSVGHLLIATFAWSIVTSSAVALDDALFTLVERSVGIAGMAMIAATVSSAVASERHRLAWALQAKQRSEQIARDAISEARSPGLVDVSG
ncbi:MAG: hypothetical protein KDB00_17610 [Planctomycetales bacterium]|nr:hypothetical protein [Planctomycetales bacterium]